MKKLKELTEKMKRKSSEDRKYVSYEDVPLAEYRDSDPVPNNLTKKFFRVFIIIFLGVVGIRDS